MFTLQIAINGILLGGLYALMALGMSLIWGVMNIINIAHGAFIMLGAYVTFFLFRYLGLDPFLSIPLSMLVLFIFGFLLQRYLINWVVQATMFITLLLAFGIDILLTNGARIAFSANFYRVNPSYGGARLDLGSLTIPEVRLAAFLVALLIALLLFLLLKRTKLGRAIRATAQDLTAARLTGVKVAHIYALTFGIGVALAGAAGSLWSVLFGVHPAMGGPLTLKSFVVVIIGGLGSTTGPIVGGLILGLAEVFSSAWLGDTWKNVISFGLLVLILVIRPQGILGGTK